MTMNAKSKILIVDDDPFIRQTLKLIFEEDDNQYAVLEAEGVVEGLEKAALELPQLIITDVMMSRLTGYDLIVGVRSSPALKHIPLMVYSAKEPPVEKECLELGANVYLKKPADIHTLRAKAKAMLGHPN